jgi:hypothetical protein
MKNNIDNEESYKNFENILNRMHDIIKIQKENQNNKVKVIGDKVKI